MSATDQFTRQEFQRILDVSEKQLSYWEKLHLISPRKPGAAKFYDFRDLISLRTAKQLIETGVPASRLRRSMVALHQKLSEVESPLTELRIRSNGKDVIVEREGARLEPLTGQFVLNFDTRELIDKVRVMPERSAEDWFALGLQHDSDPATRKEAAAAYERAISIDPGHVDALINLGMLFYDHADLEKAAKCFDRAVQLAPDNAIAQFNLGSVLDEVGRLEDARQHLRLAVRWNPRYADAHYNLAFVCDKLGALTEAREHWSTYIKLDPASTWCEYARRRLSSIG
jgi:DNA-binding transcriptional MerR regulator